MLAQNWGWLLAVVVAAIVTPLLWTNLEPRQPNLPAYEYGESASTDYQVGGTGCEPKVLATLPNNRESVKERERCAEAAGEYHLRRDDIVQQTRAADAAQEQARTNYDLARMALWGTIGGFLTLVAVILAAFYARQASLASRETVAAFIAVERAALVATVAGGDLDGAMIKLALDISNVGRSSAQILDVLFAPLRHYYPEDFNGVSILSHLITRDETLSFPGAIAIRNDLETHPFVGGYVIYQSRFGVHQTYFCAAISERPREEWIYGGSRFSAKSAKPFAGWPHDT